MPVRIKRGAMRLGMGLAMVVACAGWTGLAFGQSEAAVHQTTYYLHGRIYTNDPKVPWAAGLAVRDGKIYCVGTLEHVLLDCGGAGSAVETVQLKGRLVLPGFNDAHV